MAVVRASSKNIEALVTNPASVRFTGSAIEGLVFNTPKVRGAGSVVEAAVNNTPKTHGSGLVVESSVNDPRNMRSSLVVIECLIAILEETMATAVYPLTLKGMTFGVSKRPMFSNRVAVHTSGQETATSYWDNPKWEFDVSYDWLPDRPTGPQDFKALLGFFLNMRGNFQTWLFSDPDDNAVVAGYQKTFDGVSVEMPFVRGISGFYEPVGQVRTDTPLNIWLDVVEANTVPAAGPFTRTVAHASEWVLDQGVKKAGVPMTAVASAPATGQYSVAAGVYTFAAADANAAILISYRYLAAPASYTVTMPHTAIFTVAPAAGAVVTATFQYYFVCRFKESMADFHKFSNQLWELQRLSFISQLA